MATSEAAAPTHSPTLGAAAGHWTLEQLLGSALVYHCAQKGAGLGWLPSWPMCGCRAAHSSRRDACRAVHGQGAQSEVHYLLQLGGREYIGALPADCAQVTIRWLQRCSNCPAMTANASQSSFYDLQQWLIVQKFTNRLLHASHTTSCSSLRWPSAAAGCGGRCGN